MLRNDRDDCIKRRVFTEDLLQLNFCLFQFLDKTNKPEHVTSNPNYYAELRRSE